MAKIKRKQSRNAFALWLNKNRLSIRQVSTALNRGTTTVAKWRQGKAKPTQEHLDQIREKWPDCPILPEVAKELQGVK
jgi:DNA-binding transcriptional regulator YiaG